MSKLKEPPPMFMPFDSYVENDRVVMLTNEYSEIHGENVTCTHYLSLGRAKEILKDLQEAINSLEKSRK